MKTEEALAYFKENYPLLKIVEFDESSLLFYDARANMVFIVSNDDLPIVEEYLKTHDKKAAELSFPETKGIDEVIKRIDDLQKKGVLLPGPTDRLISTEPKDVEDHVKYNLENIFMRKFVLETTQQCNFRCKYCHNTIETVFRHHTNKQMSLPVAKAAIDFYKSMYLKFYNRLPEDKKEFFLSHYAPFVGFYGGETSLNWTLVENAYEYYVHAGWEKYGIDRNVLQCTINSNLYILTDNMFHLMVLKRKMTEIA